jgi:chromosome segregation ATPase
LAVQQAEKERLEQVLASQAAELGAAQQDTRTATENALAAERQRAAAEAEKAATLARCEKLETVTGDARADALAAEHKLKARIEEVKELAHQLGEASEELAERRKQALQLQANLDAAHATRQTLEQEVARLESALATAQAAAVPPPPPAPDQSGELASLKEEVREWEREVSSWKGKAEELEAELLVTSRAHRELETDAERLLKGTCAAGADEALLHELELMTRERNDMAAELAVLKAQAKGNEET